MKYKFIFIFLVAVLSGNAQTYSINPAKSVTFLAAYNNVTINDIYMVNTGNTTLSITWELVSINLPVGWDKSMCDLGTCHPGIPVGPTTMSTAVAGGANPFLGLNIDPSNIPGTGTVVVRVYKTGSPAAADTLTWVATSSPTGIEEIGANGKINLYPNPVSDQLHIDLIASEVNEIKVTDLMGRIVLTKGTGEGKNILNVSGLSKGVYLVNVTTPEKVYVKRLVKD